MTFSLFDVVSIVIICQLLFLIIAIRLVPDTNVLANKILQLILAIFCFFLIERLVLQYVFTIDRNLILKYGFTSNFLYYTLGPLIYMYVRRLIIDDKKPYFLNFKHFIPAIIYIVFILFHMFKYEDIISSNYLRTLRYTWEITSVISIVFYLIKSNHLLSQFVKNQKLNFSFDQAVIRYLKIMLGIIALTTLCWILHIINGLLVGSYANTFLFLMWIFYGVLAYIISIFSLRHPHIFKLNLKDETTSKSDKSRLNSDEISNLKVQIDNYIQIKKAYRRPELSLSVMAQDINTSPNNLSWLLNNVFNQSFYEFINVYRVKEFVERIKNNDHKEYTLISIAQEVGFKSKSTFYKAFKEITKKTPSNFIKELNNTNEESSIKKGTTS